MNESSFSIEKNMLHGVRIVANKPLMPLCLSEATIEWHIQRLKDDLDRAAVLMKATVRQWSPPTV